MRFVKLFAPIFLLLIVAVTSTAAHDNDNETINPEPLAKPIMVRDENAPALASIAALYAPTENKESWLQLVCAGMTDGGCMYFRDNQADAVWQGQHGNDASWVSGNISDTIVINETAQVWKAQTSVFTREEKTFDVYVLVERGADGSWHLNRVLNAPGISQ